MVTDQRLFLSDECQEVGTGALPLAAGFFNCETSRTYNVDPIFIDLAYQKQDAVDIDITNNLRNFLFGDPNSLGSGGLRLASLNMQRGRNHGLQDYYTVRAEYLGRSIWLC